MRRNVLLDVAALVEVRRHLANPHALDRRSLPHPVRARLDDLVEHDDLWLHAVDGQHGGRVDADGQLRLQRAVVLPVAGEDGGVREVAREDGLEDRDVVRGAGRGERDVDALAQLLDLLLDQSRALQAAVLDEVLVGPVLHVVGVDPAVVDVEQGQVVAAFMRGEAGAGAVSVHLLVFGPEEQVGGLAEHGDDDDDFLCAFIFLGGD